MVNNDSPSDRVEVLTDAEHAKHPLRIRRKCEPARSVQFARVVKLEECNHQPNDQLGINPQVFTLAHE